MVTHLTSILLQSLTNAILLLSARPWKAIDILKLSLTGEYSRSLISVVIGAATAAAILQIASDGKIEPERYYRLQTSDGMGQVLGRLGRMSSNYCYISPLELGKSFDESLKPVDRVPYLLL